MPIAGRECKEDLCEIARNSDPRGGFRFQSRPLGSVCQRLSRWPRSAWEGFGDDVRGRDRAISGALISSSACRIKEIVRTLRVSRATVRKVVRSHKTAFKYERGVQPAPKLGAWVGVIAQILEKEATLPRRERRSTQRLFEELRGRGYDSAHGQRASFHQIVARRAGSDAGARLCAAELCARRSLPVRLEPRDHHAAGFAAGHQGGAHEAVA